MHPVIIFDGYCRLCHWSVQFLLRHDHKRLFRFTTLEGSYAKDLPLHRSSDQAADSVLLWHESQLFAQSDAVLKMLSLLGGWWKISALGYLLPRFIRNKVYQMVAKYRYSIFGKYAACPIPMADTANLFLD